MAWRRLVVFCTVGRPCSRCRRLRSTSKRACSSRSLQGPPGLIAAFGSGYRGGQLYKKRPTSAKPCRSWSAAICTHLIHRTLHSLWGQVQKSVSRYPQGLQAVLESFLLDLGMASMQPRPTQETGRSGKGWLQASNDAASASLSRV